MIPHPLSFIQNNDRFRMVIALVCLMIVMLLAAGCISWLGGRYEFDQDIRISKLNADGFTIWTKQIDSGNYDYALDFIPTSDGGFLILGGKSTIRCNKFPPSYPEIPTITRISADGDLVWEHDYSDRINVLIENKDGSLTAVSDDGMIKNLNSEGMEVNKHDPGLHNPRVSDGGRIDIIIPLDEGGYLIAGETIAKIDPRGNAIWQVFNGTSLNKAFSAVELTNQQGYLVVVYGNTMGPKILHLNVNGSVVTSIPMGNFDTLSKPIIHRTETGYTLLSINTICPEHSSFCNSFYSAIHFDNNGQMNATVNLSEVNSQTMLVLNDGSFISYEVISPGNLVKEIRLNPDGTVAWEKMNKCVGESCPSTSSRSPIATFDNGFAILDPVKKQHNC